METEDEDALKLVDGTETDVELDALEEENEEAFDEVEELAGLGEDEDGGTTRPGRGQYQFAAASPKYSPTGRLCYVLVTD